QLRAGLTCKLNPAARHAFKLLLLSAVALPAVLHGQSGILPAPKTDVYLYGTVKALETHDSLPGASIRLSEWPSGQELLHLVANERGRYEVQLNRAGTYRLTYEAEGRVGKSVEIDLASVPDSAWAGGLAMNVDIALFRPRQGVDYSLLKEPLGKAGFDPATGTIAWDL